MSTRSPIVKTRFNSAVKNLKKLLSNEKKLVVQNYLERLTATEATAEYLLWKATSILNKVRENTSPIKKNNRTWARIDKEKADVFVEHLTKRMVSPRYSNMLSKCYSR